jgi:hypothetical protein
MNLFIRVPFLVFDISRERNAIIRRFFLRAQSMRRFCDEPQNYAEKVSHTVPPAIRK